MTDWNKRFKKISDDTRRAKKRASSTFGAEPASVVAQVQQKLNDLGQSPPLTIDGSAGPLTNAAVLAFQQSRRLSADGVIGPQTLGALGLSTSSTTAAKVTSSGVVPLPTINGPAIGGLKQTVINSFTSFSQGLEGKGTNFPYTDSKGYVTTGIGNLIDPIGTALGLAWRHGTNGPLASQQEIIDGWNAVKDAYPDVQSYASSSLTDLRLDDTAMADLVASKMKSNHDVLRSEFPGYVNWPADGQMAIHSISWEWGAGFPNVWGQNGIDFKSALNQTKPDFAKASSIMTAASQHEESINPGTIKRDADNRVLWQNAADVQSKKGNYNLLYYPGPVVVALAGMLGLFLTAAGGVLTFLSWKNMKAGHQFLPWIAK
jgi:hypothetical protein